MGTSCKIKVWPWYAYYSIIMCFMVSLSALLNQKAIKLASLIIYASAHGRLKVFFKKSPLLFAMCSMIAPYGGKYFSPILHETSFKLYWFEVMCQ